MILLQVFASRTGSKREPPGPARGDIVLTQDALPEKIGDWKQVSFVPAPPVEELPEGQYWWVHQWQYSNGANTAIVSFDQLGEDQWHELTYCYRNLDWKIDSREIRIDGVSNAPFAVVTMSKEAGEKAVLVFSVFLEDGSWAAPPDVNLHLVNSYTQNRGVVERAKTRLIPIPMIILPESNSGHTRALQC